MIIIFFVYTSNSKGCPPARTGQEKCAHRAALRRLASIAEFASAFASASIRLSLRLNIRGMPKFSGNRSKREEKSKKSFHKTLMRVCWKFIQNNILFNPEWSSFVFCASKARWPMIKIGTSSSAAITIAALTALWPFSFCFDWSEARSLCPLPLFFGYSLDTRGFISSHQGHSVSGKSSSSKITDSRTQERARKMIVFKQPVNLAKSADSHAGLHSLVFTPKRSLLADLAYARPNLRSVFAPSSFQSSQESFIC